MNFYDVIFDNIYYTNDRIYYKGKTGTFKFITPAMKCVNGIEEKEGKYYIRLELDMGDDNCVNFISFIRSLENKHRGKCKFNYYRSLIDENNNVRFTIILKYKRPMIKLVGYDTLYDLKRGDYVKCIINNQNIWNVITDMGGGICGSVMSVDSIEKSCV